MSDEKINRLFDRFDADHDGYLDVSELTSLIKYFSAGNGSDEKAASGAKFAIAIFGKTVNGKVTRAEFTKMVRAKH